MNEPSSSSQEAEEEDISGESDSEDQGRKWDNKCYVCNRGGNVLCCETCTHIAHLGCVGLRKEPEGDWHCEECLVKLTQKRVTRGQALQ